MKELEISKIEHEHAIKEEESLMKELNFITSMMKELKPTYAELENLLEHLFNQPEDGSFYRPYSIRFLYNRIILSL